MAVTVFTTKRRNTHRRPQYGQWTPFFEHPILRNLIIWYSAPYNYPIYCRSSFNNGRNPINQTAGTIQFPSSGRPSQGLGATMYGRSALSSIAFVRDNGHFTAALWSNIAQSVSSGATTVARLFDPGPNRSVVQIQPQRESGTSDRRCLFTDTAGTTRSVVINKNNLIGDNLTVCRFNTDTGNFDFFDAGELIAQTTGLAGVLTTQNIGSVIFTGNAGAQVPIADFKFWDRCLTDKEIWSLYSPLTRWDTCIVKDRYAIEQVTPAAGRIFKLAGEGGGLAGPSRGLAAARMQ